MANLTMFLEKDQEEADKELNCYGHLMKNAIGHMANGDFGKAAIYHENIVRSLKSLDEMKESKDNDNSEVRRHWF